VHLFQRIKRYAAQRHDHSWINERDRAAEEVRAVANFARAWPAIGAGWFTGIAQGGAGDEDFGPRQAD